MFYFFLFYCVSVSVEALLCLTSLQSRFIFVSDISVSGYRCHYVVLVTVLVEELFGYFFILVDLSDGFLVVCGVVEPVLAV